MSNPSVPSDPGEFLLYHADERTRLLVRLEGETVWLLQRDMAGLFQNTKQSVSLHIQNIFDEGELTPEATVTDYLTVQTEGSGTSNDASPATTSTFIISVGYRVKSLRGTARYPVPYPSRTPFSANVGDATCSPGNRCAAFLRVGRPVRGRARPSLRA